MDKLLTNPAAWWIAFLLSVSLPFVVYFGVTDLGGYFASYMLRSAFQWLMFFCWWAALIACNWLLFRAQRVQVLRVLGSLAISLLFALASCGAMVSGCLPEYIELTRLGEKTPVQLAAGPQGESCG